MLAAQIKPGEKLVYSTRWGDPEESNYDLPPQHWLTIEIVIHDEQRDERLAALSQRSNLFNFLKGDVRSHVAA